MSELSAANLGDANRLLSFEDSVVWVTGAGRGIGWEIAALFSRLGAKVIGFDLAFEKGSAFMAGAIALNIADTTAIDATLPEAVSEYGEPDIFINAAGVLCLGTIGDLSREDWFNSFEVNVFGCFYFLQTLMPIFKARQSGAVVTVCSNSAHMARYKMAAYGASKAALISLTRSAGLELAEHGVRVNSVSPGSTLTPMQTHMWKQGTNMNDVIRGNLEQFRLGIPLQKIAQPVDIAHAVVFLASPLASHITMQDIVVDGGATLGS